MGIAQRIRQARVAAEMSQRELAKRVGVSAMAISKYERGMDTPRASVLLRLARALGVETEFFFRETHVQVCAPAYRKRANLTERAQAAVEALVVDYLDKYLYVEGLFPGGRTVEFRTPQVRPLRTIEDVEEVAESLRDEWGLGRNPIENLTATLEDNGVKVFLLDRKEGFDGFSCWANGSIPVVVCPSGIPGDRQRFTLAHELGHLVLGSFGGNLIEKAAYRFAGGLLAPRAAVFHELGTKRSFLTFEELHILKQKYGLSMQAWTRRARDLGVISESTYRSMCKQFSMLKWRKEEPGDQVPDERPMRFSLLVYQAVAEGLITPSEGALLLGQRPAVSKDLSGIDLLSDAEAVAREYQTDRGLILEEDEVGEVYTYD